MTSVKVRHRPFFNDFDVEERWLNEMAAQGLNLIRPGLRYTFEQGTPQEWVYRIQLLAKDAKKRESREYLEFAAASGADVVFAKGRIAYFRKRTSDGAFELFSDRESRIAYLRRVRRFFAWWVAFVIGYGALYANMFGAADTMPFAPLVRDMMLGALVCFVLGGAMLLVQVARITRQIRSLEAQQLVYE